MDQAELPDARVSDMFLKRWVTATVVVGVVGTMLAWALELQLTPQLAKALHWDGRFLFFASFPPGTLLAMMVTGVMLGFVQR